MASSTATPGPAPRQTAGSDGELVSYGEFIERQLGKTKTQVKAVEFFTELTLLGIGILAYLSVVVLADHWLVRGGLGGGGRFLALLVLLAAGGGYAWWRVLPLLLRRINPIYAADAIERSQPSLKNSVINFLLLRSSGSPMSKLIYDAIEQRAATDLSQVTAESAVDRTRLIKIFYVLVGLVAVACVYKLASPKDPLQSVFRVVLPWMDLATPTRVTIDDVKPGNAQVFTGDTVTVTALVNGVRPDEAVTLYYTSDDQSISQEPITLKKPQDGYRHEAKLPAGGAGLGQNVSYYLEAGDVRSEVFRIGVQPPPTIVVEEIEYEYPSYTHLARHVEKFKGDIKAPEGTLVTIRAKANQAIEPDSAVLDLDSDGVPPALKMRVEGQAAWCAFLLNVKPDDTPEHEDYLLRFRNASGQLNPNPIRYKIEILPDRAPTIEFVTPAKDTELPRNSTLVLKLKAADPDFALSQVTLRIERDGKHLLGTAELPGEPLLTSDPAPQFEHTYTLDPSKLLLSAGDEIVYWAVATDNKQPVANETASHHWRVKILPPIDPSQQPPKQDQLAQNDPNQKQPNPQPPKDPKNQNPKNQPRDPNDKQPPDQNPQPEDGKNDGKNNDKTGQPGDNQKNGGEGSKQNERVNPETDPGKAFEEILKQQKKEEQNGKQGDDSQEQPGGKQPPEESADRKNDKQKPSKEPKQGDDKNSQPQPDEKGSDSKQGDSKQGDQKKSDGESGDKRQSGDPSGKEKSDGGKEGSQETPGKDGQPDGGNGKKEGSAEQKQGKEQGDTKNAGEKQPGKNEQQKADLKSGEKGEQKSGDSKPGDKKGENASEKNGTGKPEADKSGKEPNGEKQQGKTDTKPGAEKQPGETKAGDAAKPEKGGKEKTGELQPKDQADNKQETGDSEKGEAKAGPTEKKDPTKKPGSEDKEGGDREQNHGKKAGPGDSKEGTSNPSPQGDEKGRDKAGKSSKSSDEKSSEKGEKASSPSISDSESNTEGKEHGDRKGGGKEGSGQKADKKGKGPAGTNTEANSGGSKSDGSGDGETGKQPGAKKKSEEKTGQAGSKEAGNGSESKQKTDGKGSGENPESKQGGKAGDESQSNEKSNPQDSKQDQDGKSGKQGDGTPKDETPEGDPDGRGRGNPTQGGNKNTDVQDDGRRDRKTEGQADEVNVDYANKATELALKHLKDELAKEKPNQELLDRLGWTRDDMQKFVNRWDQMRTDARKSGPENADARRRWEETLRGLGLSPGGTALDTRGTKTDQLRDLRERTFVPAPAEYRDRARGYKTGISKPTTAEPPK